MRHKPIVFNPYYAFQVKEDEDTDLYICTVYKQTTKNRSRNEVEVYTTSQPMDLDEAVDWGEHLVKALSK